MPRVLKVSTEENIMKGKGNGVSAGKSTGRRTGWKVGSDIRRDSQGFDDLDEFWGNETDSNSVMSSTQSMKSSSFTPGSIQSKKSVSLGSVSSVKSATGSLLLGEGEDVSPKRLSFGGSSSKKKDHSVSTPVAPVKEISLPSPEIVVPVSEPLPHSSSKDGSSSSSSRRSSSRVSRSVSRSSSSSSSSTLLVVESPLVVEEVVPNDPPSSLAAMPSPMILSPTPSINSNLGPRDHLMSSMKKKKVNRKESKSPQVSLASSSLSDSDDDDNITGYAMDVPMEEEAMYDDHNYSNTNTPVSNNTTTTTTPNTSISSANTTPVSVFNTPGSVASSTTTTPTSTTTNTPVNRKRELSDSEDEDSESEAESMATPTPKQKKIKKPSKKVRKTSNQLDVKKSSKVSHYNKTNTHRGSSSGGGKGGVISDEEEEENVEEQEVEIRLSSQPMVNSNPTPGVRRSTRRRVTPLEYWKSERVVYQKDDGIVGVVKDSVPTPYTKSNRSKGMKRQQPKKQSKKKEEVFAPPSDHDVVYNETDSAVVIHKYGKDSKDKIERKEKVITRGYDFNFVPLGDNGSTAGAAFDKDSFLSGKLRVSPLDSKPTELVTVAAQGFYVVDSQPNALEFNVNGDYFLLSPGDHMTVPKDNVYSLKNYSDSTTAVIFFYCIKR